MIFDLPPMETAYIFALVGFFGACMGSFLNCLGWRIVHGESAWKGRSHCDHCGHVLTPADLVPIVSYVAHHGRCRWCGEKISSRHLWGEVIAALVYISVLLRFGLTADTVQYLLWLSLLLAASFADLEGYIIPDRFLIAAVVVRLVFILISDNPAGQLLQAALGGFTVALGLLLIVMVFEKIIGREAMGGGDIKLIFVIGLYLGWQRNLLCLLISCIIGIVFALLTQSSRSDNEDARAFPFGPSIAMAAWITLLWGDGLLQFYLGLF